MVLVDYIGIFLPCGNTFGHMLYTIVSELGNNKPASHSNTCENEVHGHRYSSPSIFHYIFHIKPVFQKKNILKLSLGRLL